MVGTQSNHLGEGQRKCKCRCDDTAGSWKAGRRWPATQGMCTFLAEGNSGQNWHCTAGTAATMTIYIPSARHRPWSAADRQNICGINLLNESIHEKWVVLYNYQKSHRHFKCMTSSNLLEHKPSNV